METVPVANRTADSGDGSRAPFPAPVSLLQPTESDALRTSVTSM